MNIKEAKIQIKNAMKAYFTKDSFGRYVIPPEEQRPVFLMGPPGIGKTAVMEQIASELGVGLVSYSMTHHTRQSALGLPYIVQKTYNKKEYQVSEYTMSEIIASVYELMEESGVREGILFLDEINCVSETLAPSMLQFLQYKIFGRHHVPEGWIVVTAGNPPEYNNSVREFDIVTWDRLKRIDLEPDYGAWKEYAYKSGIHPSIITYLDIKKEDFYKIESTVDGKRFVTARGWSDLSKMIRLYEQNKISVDEKLISQYLQDTKIAKNFSVYYDLFNKYRSDYQVDKILEGTADQQIRSRAKAAPFDERLSLLGLLLDSVTKYLKQVYFTEQALNSLFELLKEMRMLLLGGDSDAEQILENQRQKKLETLEQGRLASSLSKEAQHTIELLLKAIDAFLILLKKENPDDADKAFALLKKEYDRRNKSLKKMAADAGKKLSNLFLFCEEVFGEGQETLILVTELTISYYGAHFISRYGCKEYFAHNKNLLFHERRKEILAELQNLMTDSQS